MLLCFFLCKSKYSYIYVNIFTMETYFDDRRSMLARVERYFSKSSDCSRYPGTIRRNRPNSLKSVDISIDKASQRSTGSFKRCSNLSSLLPLMEKFNFKVCVK